MGLSDILRGFAKGEITPASKLNLIYPAKLTQHDTRAQDFYLPSIAVGGQYIFSVNYHTPNMRRFGIMNYVEIHNPSTTALSVRIESPGGEMYRIEAGMNRKLRVSFNNLIFTNIGLNVLPINVCHIIIRKEFA